MCFTMGNIEEGKSSTSDKSSPVPPDQTNIHVYPDGVAMQAYYGPRVALPPYYNSAVASGHAPHPYMWGLPQHMMPHFGAPYATVYSHGVYAHPAVPIVSHPHGPGIVSSPAAGTLLSAETPTKSSGNTDRGLVNKLKGFDGLAMSIGNGNAETFEGGGRLSQSVETEVSSDGIDGNSTREKKRSREGTPTVATGGDTKMESHSSPLPREVNASTDNVLRAAVAPGMTTALELRNPPSVNAAKTSPTTIPQSGVVLPSEAWLQNELELKREKRKQSNRESARRSRLRKQAEAEELAHKVEVLTTENMALQSEINQFTEKSEKLRLENAALTEKLKNAQLGHAQEMILNIDEHRAPAACTENLLSRVNNSAFEEESDLYERNSNSGAKLHQLLDASPRAGALAAG
ncbi:PREDICTED: G-box-binding factor 3-like isoform X1 [Populus euphratica]|uniref:G-box-binding factor 3-like isoform X1 n=2 Tax=Populus euphratica TaxID=75702 RepID=A0AAJ6U5B0_POPEU|nr:PREDICTED: G-box-binding factor 3-like isoform X1 [Populus euphratica]XP_011023233.1 PREDICTED: G-box-binding factor 3-like isoform X1 [Populus euphratica]XP_011023234.1 PREDICTED: G-box-binding factor 3-like isoform X1 [Populus euphratica]XP_011023235.1 PREDICTED: G-box-binding factor 3-like isoform X1 [Populus euphratica]XP_011023236.1 PREDICTED: G-box-binding factor 3-like isoform X1 [Populus euphratica]